MATSGFFDNPFMIGFDELERVLETMGKSSGDGFPPYNIEQINHNHICISLAVAGFVESELDITLHGNELLIRGKQDTAKDSTERVYLHRGIAARQFQKRFALADGMEIEAADLSDGLLYIHVHRRTEDQKIRKIPIRSSDDN